jgi:DNA primase
MSMGGEWVDFRAVKATVSLAEVLRAYQVDWLRVRRPDQLYGRCPIHGGGRVDAFHVSLSRNAFQCFACQARGNVLDFVAAMEQCSVREAARRLAHRFSIPERLAAVAVAAGSTSGERANWLGKKEGCNPPLSFTLRGIDGSHPYLRARRILPETAAVFGVGFYSGRGLMSGRVVIPIHDRHGKLAAYAGRSLDGSPPKYRLPAGFRKSEVLFNFHRAAALDQKSVVVVEGYFDCLKVHQAGFPSVVALMGTVLPEVPEALLLEQFRRVVLMLDGDDSGRRATEKIAAQLAGRCSIRLVEVPVGSQPDQLERGEIRTLLNVTET